MAKRFGGKYSPDAAEPDQPLPRSQFDGARVDPAGADYVALLDDLDQNFAARTRKSLLDDRSDMTVEIEVLRDRLKREGVRMK